MTTKKAKFRNVSRKGKTFDGYEKEFLPMEGKKMPRIVIEDE